MPTRCFLVEIVPRDDVFDVRQVDSGELIAEGVAHFMDRPVGAMWWSDMEEKAVEYQPSGPQDYGDRTPEELDLLRQQAQEHPEWWRSGIDATTGLPNRQPTYLFDSGPQLTVQTPGGPWNIDSRASNCGRPWDYTHRCWVRHGEPPNITVDKNGDTCSAGAGSIRCGDYHGFLVNGELS